MVFMYFPAGLAGSRYCYMYSSYRRPPRRLVRRGGRVFNRPAGITPGKHSTFICDTDCRIAPPLPTFSVY